MEVHREENIITIKKKMTEIRGSGKRLLCTITT